MTIDNEALKAARQKYLRLGREIEGAATRGDLAHTHSKLGIFLEQALGTAWADRLEESWRVPAEQETPR